MKTPLPKWQKDMATNIIVLGFLYSVFMPGLVIFLIWYFEFYTTIIPFIVIFIGSILSGSCFYKVYKVVRKVS